MCYTGKSASITMKMMIRPGQTDQHRPMWLRVLAMVCLLVLCMASTAQVCHVHGEAPDSKDSQSSRQTVPDHCPLCVAMHSALPATERTAPEPVLQVQAVLHKTFAVERLHRWSYELFSRPPPVMETQV